MADDFDLTKKIIDAYNNIKKNPSLTHVQMDVGLCKSALTRRIKLLREEGVYLIDRDAINRGKIPVESVSSKEEITKAPEIVEPKVVRENNQLRQQIKSMKQQVDALQMEAATTERLLTLIHGAKEYGPVQGQPDWLTYKTDKNIESIIPLLFISDVHFDEVVHKDHMGGINEFNHEICVRRLKNTFNTFLDTLVNKMRDVVYDGAIVALGGDIVSGTIHEELAETNDAIILQTILSAVQYLGDGIEAVADEIGRVYVPCVVGNHGRLHKKPRHKEKVQQNYEWLIYQLIAQRFAKDDRIKVDIPDTPDCLFQVYDLWILLTHGDQFKGGGGISGILTPLMLGMSKKLKRYAAIGKSFHLMMCGHFHQYIQTNSLLVNGSVKGYDEYAANFNFTYEEPQQAMLIFSKTKGIDLRLPIKCDR